MGVKRSSYPWDHLLLVPTNKFTCLLYLYMVNMYYIYSIYLTIEFPKQASPVFRQSFQLDRKAIDPIG